MIFSSGKVAGSVNLNGDETFDLLGIVGNLKPQQDVTLCIHLRDGSRQNTQLLLRIDAPIEVDYDRSGGILPYVLGGFLGRVNFWTAMCHESSSEVENSTPES